MKSKFIYIKVVFVLVMAYFTSIFVNNNVFLANSPKLNPSFAYNMQKQINSSYTKIMALINKKQLKTTPDINKNVAAELLKNSLQPISKGIRAASNESSSYIEYNLDEVEWEKITYTSSNGQEKTVLWPKGIEVPSEEYFKSID